MPLLVCLAGDESLQLVVACTRIHEVVIQGDDLAERDETHSRYDIEVSPTRPAEALCPVGLPTLHCNQYTLDVQYVVIPLPCSIDIA